MKRLCYKNFVKYFTTLINTIFICMVISFQGKSDDNMSNFKIKELKDLMDENVLVSKRDLKFLKEFDEHKMVDPNSLLGTLVGGAPSSVSFISTSRNCFKEFLTSTKISQEEEKKIFSVQVTKSDEIINFLKNHEKMVPFSNQRKVDKIILSFNNLALYSLDIESIPEENLLKKLSENCKLYLQYVGFINKILIGQIISVKLFDKNGISINSEVETNTASLLAIQFGKIKDNILYGSKTIENNKYSFIPLKNYSETFNLTQEQPSSDTENKDSIEIGDLGQNDLLDLHIIYRQDLQSVESNK